MSSNFIPEIRVGIDWDGDRFICYDTGRTDSLNLVPNALSLYTLDILGVGNGGFNRRPVQSDQGHNAWEFFVKNLVSKTSYGSANQDSNVKMKSQTIATYTADLCGDGIATAESTGAGTPYDIFGDSATAWASVNKPDWWQFEFPVAKAIRQYTVQASTAVTNRVPRSWDFSYFDELLQEWIIVDAVSGEAAWGSLEVRTYTVDVYVPAVKKWRWDNATQGTAELTIALAEAEMMEVSTYTLGNSRLAQSFQLSSDDAVAETKLYLRRVGTLSGNMTVAIHADSSGSPATNPITNGTSSEVSASSLGTSYGFITFAFPTRPQLTGSTTYWLVLSTTGAFDEFNWIEWGADGSAPSYSNGEMKREVLGVWSAESKDAIFEIWGPDSAVGAGIVFGRDATPTINDIPVSASTQYTVSVWVKGILNFASKNVRLDIRNQANSSITTSSDVTLTSGWTRINVTFTTGASDTHIAIIVENRTAGDPVWQATGHMLVPGATAYPYNVGHSTNRYDNLTVSTDPVVEAAQWQLGRSSPEGLLPAEGVATLTLDNIDKRFSPEHTSSPLFGNLLQNRKITVDIKSSAGNWINKWSGWIRSIEPEPFEAGTVQTTLRCEQGIFRLDEVPVRTGIFQNAKIEQIIPELVEGGWISTASPYYAIADQSRTDDNAFAFDDTKVLALGVGLETFPFVGESWQTGETHVTKAIEDIVIVERGFLWVDAAGKLVFFDRQHYVNIAPDLTLNLDLTVNDADYRYENDISNEIKVTYYPKETITGQLWKTRASVTIPKRSKKEIIAKFEYEEGSKISALSINAFTAAVSPSTFTATKLNGASATQYISISFVLNNGEAVLTVENSGNFPVLVTITLNGTSVVSYGSQAITITDVSSIEDHGLRRGVGNIQSSLLTEEASAQILGETILARGSQPYGTFDSVNLKTRDTTWLDRQVLYGIGSLLLVSETQTAALNKRLLVVGEKHSWRPGVLDTTWVLDRPEVPSYWVVGTSKLNVDTHLGY